MRLDSVLLIAAAVALASVADSISTVWAKTKDFHSPWFFALLIVAPLAYFSFGLVTSRVGLAVTSGVVNSLIVFSTMAVGLVMFKEWSQVSTLQYVGMGFALTGVVLMLFFPKG